ncbi:MAG: class I SAM-dependent methyltransferase [Candidatus Absconditicoccaceae bacterium]
MKKILILTIKRILPDNIIKKILIVLIERLLPGFLIEWIYNIIVKPIKYIRYPFLIFKNKDISNVFTKIHQTNFWSSNESVSGLGSEKIATRHTRKEILNIIKKYKIANLLDIPCGDCNWIEPENLGIDYIGADIVKEVIKSNKGKFDGKIDFRVLDLTVDNLPKADLILCRECLQHLSMDNIKKSLKNIKKSGAHYLLVTSHKDGKNININNGNFFTIDLEKAPFLFGTPIEEIEEIDSNIRAIRNHKQYLYLYDINKLDI